MRLGIESGAEVVLRRVPSRDATRIFALGSGIDKSLNLSVFLDLIPDASNNHEGLQKEVPDDSPTNGVSFPLRESASRMAARGR
jgi:hypothetical protein